MALPSPLISPRFHAALALAATGAVVASVLLYTVGVSLLSAAAFHGGIAAVMVCTLPLTHFLFRSERPVLVAALAPPVVSSAVSVVVALVLQYERGDGIGFAGLTIKDFGLAWPVLAALLGLGLGLAGSLVLSVPVALAMRARARQRSDARRVFTAALWAATAGGSAWALVVARSARPWAIGTLALAGVGLVVLLADFLAQRRVQAMPVQGPYRV